MCICRKLIFQVLSIEKDSVASSSTKDALDLLEAAKFLLALGCSEWDDEFINRIVHILLTHKVRGKNLREAEPNLGHPVTQAKEFHPGKVFLCAETFFIFYLQPLKTTNAGLFREQTGDIGFGGFAEKTPKQIHCDGSTQTQRAAGFPSFHGGK